VPNFNRTGYVSLKENNEGEHIQASIEIENAKLFDVMAYASEIQEEPTDGKVNSYNYFKRSFFLQVLMPFYLIHVLPNLLKC
jgi:hypothetical protein